MGNSQTTGHGDFMQQASEPLMTEVERLSSESGLTVLDDSAFNFPASFVRAIGISGKVGGRKSKPFLPPPGKASVVYRATLPASLLHQESRNQDLKESQMESAHLGEGLVEVAIRRIKLGGESGGKSSFSNEVVSISKVGPHSNIVSLLGYCSEAGEALLVYQYMPLGNLRHALFEDDNLAKVMPLSTRVQILTDIARGLSCLHEAKILHFDLRPSNVLLDKNFCAKIKGLKFSAEFVGGKPHLTQAKRIVGRVGYVCPALLETGNATPKSDVYSFGVIVLQVLAGRPFFKSEATGEVVTLASVLERPEIDLVAGFGLVSNNKNDETTMQLASSLAERVERLRIERELAEKRREVFLASKKAKEASKQPSEVDAEAAPPTAERNSYEMLPESKKPPFYEYEKLSNRWDLAEKVTSLKAFLDPRLGSSVDEAMAKKLAILGLLCVQDLPSLRPTARELVGRLEEISRG